MNRCIVFSLKKSGNAQRSVYGQHLQGVRRKEKSIQLKGRLVWHPDRGAASLVNGIEVKVLGDGAGSEPSRLLWEQG